MESFTFYNLFWYFLLYSIIGWVWEVCLVTVQEGKFVNRGFLNGPVCPIYGFGMVIMLLALTPLLNNAIVLFFGGVLLATVLELLVGWGLKKLFHTTWWDYSDMHFNLGGYICLGVSFGWGVGVLVLMHFVQPPIAALVSIIPPALGIIILCIVMVILVIDTIVTVAAILKLQKYVGKMAEISKVLREGSDALAERLGVSALAADSVFDSAKESATEAYDNAKESANERLLAAKADASARMDFARAEWVSVKTRVSERLLRAYPKLKTEDESKNEYLTLLREWSKKKNK